MLDHMTTQPRHTAGTRHAGESTGGQYTSKPTPDIKDNDIGFNDTPVVGPPNPWRERTVNLWGLETVFTRSVDDDGVVTVTVDCDDPTMVLLARKGDREYWSGGWRTSYRDRRIWAADITARMLEEGLVATWWGDALDGVTEAMSATTDPTQQQTGLNALTGTVAQIRGLRLRQSMTDTTPEHPTNYLSRYSAEVLTVYQQLPQPPWDETTPLGGQWGPQPIAGHATNRDGDDVFVGEHNDLLWRALTESDHYGWSPLKAAVLRGAKSHTEMIAAAALYDDTAQHQLTHGLFATATAETRDRLRHNTLEVFAQELKQPCPWTDEQQNQIRVFIDLVETMNT